MGFGIKIAPGVRISSGRRGVRAGIGPRAARVHVGSGRPSISTGAGPVTVWHPVGGTARRRPSRPRSSTGASPRAGPRPSLAAIQRQTVAASRQHQIQAVADAERQMVSAHLASFPSPSPPAPVTPDLIRPALVTAAVAGIAGWKLRARRQARAAAAAQAPEVAKQRYQAAFDAYALLSRNDPATVLHTLEGVFADNEHPAAPIDCRDGVATVLILFDPVGVVPDQAPAVTPSGRPTLHKRSVADRHHLYNQALASTVLATVKEAYATCPFLSDIKVLVVRRDPEAATPAGVLDAIYAGRFPAARVAALPWATLDPVEQLLTAPDALYRRTGAHKEVAPLDLAGEPDLQTVLDHLRRSL